MIQAVDDTVGVLDDGDVARILIRRCRGGHKRAGGARSRHLPVDEHGLRGSLARGAALRLAAMGEGRSDRNNYGQPGGKEAAHGLHCFYYGLLHTLWISSFT